MSDTAVKSLIDTVRILNDKYDQLEKLTGEKFNIFTILNMESDEVKTHSKFIYELLNPNGSHGSGDLFIRLFLDELPRPKAKDREKPEDKDYGKIIKVIREYTIKNDRRIDFLIETEKYVIGIEMKIYAGDQDDQLSDYWAALKRMCKNSEQKPILYYLTLFGDDASDESTQDLELEKDYRLLSFSNHIYNWIEKCIEKSATKPIVREALVQYQNLIKKLTNRISNNMEEEMKKILKTPGDIKAAHTIYSEYLKIWADKEAEFWLALYKKLKENEILDNFEIYGDSYDYENIENNRKVFSDNIIGIRIYNKYFGLKLSKETGSYAIEFIIYEYTKKGEIQIDFFIRNKRSGKKKLPQQVIRILKECGFTHISDKTICWTELLDLSFTGVNSPEPTFKLFDQNKFDEYVNETVKKSVEHIKKVLDRQDEILEALSNKRG